MKAFSPCSLLTQVLGGESPMLSILSIVKRPSTFILTLSITIVYLCKESTNIDSKVLHKDCCLLYNTSVALADLSWTEKLFCELDMKGFSVRKLYLKGEGLVHFDDISFIILDKNKVDFDLFWVFLVNPT